MGKRLTRIFGIDIPVKAKELISTELNVILKNKSTLHGVLIGVESNCLILRDMKLRKHKLSIADIEELIFDSEAAY